jgi:hypothetical protein
LKKMLKDGLGLLGERQHRGVVDRHTENVRCLRLSVNSP